MRKFHIEYDGTRISLNNEAGIMLTDPEGLGFTMNPTYSEIGNGFFKMSHNTQTQGSVTGTLVFFSTAYESYKTFVDKLLTADKLVLVYDPNGTEYKADVSINFITKSESHGGVWMTVPISFKLESLWYTETTTTATDSLSITAGGQVGTAVLVTASGALTNPSIKGTDADGVFMRADLTLSVESGSTLEYSNMWDDCHIRVNGNDVVSSVDTQYPIYGHSTKAFTLTLPGTCTVKIRKYWRTV